MWCSTDASGEWVTEFAANVAASWCPIDAAFASDGAVHAVFSEDSGAPRYVTNTSGDFVVESIEASASLWPGISVALVDDEPILAWWDADTALVVTEPAADGWSMETFSAFANGAYLELEADPRGGLHVGYLVDEQLYCASSAGGWAPALACGVDFSTGFFPIDGFDLEIDPTGQVVWATICGEGTAFCFSESSGSTVIRDGMDEVLSEDGGWHPSVARSGDGRIVFAHVAYGDGMVATMRAPDGRDNDCDGVPW